MLQIREFDVEKLWGRKMWVCDGRVCDAGIKVKNVKVKNGEREIVESGMPHVPLSGSVQSIPSKNSINCVTVA